MSVSIENNKKIQYMIGDLKALYTYVGKTIVSSSVTGALIAGSIIMADGIIRDPAIAKAVIVGLQSPVTAVAAGVVAGVIGVGSWVHLNSGNRAIAKKNNFRLQLMDLERQALETGVSPEDIEMHVTSHHQREDVPSKTTKVERTLSLAALIRREQGDVALQNETSMSLQEFERVSNSLGQVPKALSEEIQALKDAGLHELAKKELTKHSLSDLMLHTGRGVLKNIVEAHGFKWNTDAAMQELPQVKHKIFYQEVNFLAKTAEEQGVPLDQVKIQFVGLDRYKEELKARREANFYEVPLSQVVSGEVTPQKGESFKIEKSHESIALEQISDLADRLKHRRISKEAAYQSQEVKNSSTVKKNSKNVIGN